jgi:hypothetical protein
LDAVAVVHVPNEIKPREQGAEEEEGVFAGMRGQWIDRSYNTLKTFSLTRGAPPSFPYFFLLPVQNSHFLDALALLERVHRGRRHEVESAKAHAARRSRVVARRAHLV